MQTPINGVNPAMSSRKPQARFGENRSDTPARLGNPITPEPGTRNIQSGPSDTPVRLDTAPSQIRFGEEHPRIRQGLVGKAITGFALLATLGSGLFTLQTRNQNSADLSDARKALVRRADNIEMTYKQELDKANAEIERLRRTIEGVASGESSLKQQVIKADKAAETRLIALESKPSAETLHHELSQKALDATLHIEPSSPKGKKHGAGSATVVTAQGKVFILSNEHVVRGILNDSAPGSEKAPFRFASMDGKTTFDTSLVYADAGIDLAVFEVPKQHEAALRKVARPLPTLRDGQPWLKAGSPVYVAGNPMGYRDMLTFGVASLHEERLSPGKMMPMEYPRVVHTDAAINNGNSGGIIMNGHGEVVALAECTIEGTEGIAFGVPADAIFFSLADHGQLKAEPGQEKMQAEYKAAKKTSAEKATVEAAKTERIHTVILDLVKEMVTPETLAEVKKEAGDDLHNLTSHFYTEHMVNSQKTMMEKFDVDISQLSEVDLTKLSPKAKRGLTILVDDLLVEHGVKDRKPGYVKPSEEDPKADTKAPAKK